MHCEQSVTLSCSADACHHSRQCIAHWIAVSGTAHCATVKHHRRLPIPNLLPSALRYSETPPPPSHPQPPHPPIPNLLTSVSEALSGRPWAARIGAQLALGLPDSRLAQSWAKHIIRMHPDKLTSFSALMLPTLLLFKGWGPLISIAPSAAQTPRLVGPSPIGSLLVSSWGHRIGPYWGRIAIEPHTAITSIAVCRLKAPRCP